MKSYLADFLGIVVNMTIVVELVARCALGLGDPPLSVKHPTTEYLFNPNQDLQGFGNRILVNRYGMRSDDFPDEGAQ